MELLDGMSMYPSSILEDDQSDVVSSIVYSDKFKETHRYCKDLQEIADFHLQCIVDALKLQAIDTNYSAPETMVYDEKSDNQLATWQNSH
jgi:hypothetical protein